MVVVCCSDMDFMEQSFGSVMNGAMLGESPSSFWNAGAAIMIGGNDFDCAVAVPELEAFATPVAAAVVGDDDGLDLFADDDFNFYLHANDEVECISRAESPEEDSDSSSDAFLGPYSHDEVYNMDTKSFNGFIKEFRVPPAEVKKLKVLRRRRKNCVYQKSSRAKKTMTMKQALDENAKLKMALLEMKSIFVDMKKENRLKQKEVTVLRKLEC
jgi:hypothetical protein